MTATRRPVVSALTAAFSILALLSPACSPKPPAPGAAAGQLPADFPSGKPFFVRVPSPEDWRWLGKPVPSFDKVRRFGPLRDLRHADLGRLDLAGRGRELLDSFFDMGTKWPPALPPGFDPAEVLDLNRNPGLGIRALHAKGITGKGVAVGIIDAPLLLDHDEYAGRVRYYGEVNAWNVPANFHGTLVTSILAGLTCGVVPDAEIYYVGSHNYDADPDGMSTKPNASHYAKAIDLLLEVNARLPREKRIRAISISAGWSPRNPGFKAMNTAVRRATAAGIFVVSVNLVKDFEPGLWFWGLDRAAADDPDDPASYRVLSWNDWISQIGGRDRTDLFVTKLLKRAGSPEILLLPQGSKTVAQAGGRGEYGFYRGGGWSSIMPYIAGLYALACQVRPDITPEGFWRAALATGDPVPVERDGRSYAGKRVNPGRLIEALREDLGGRSTL